MAAQTAYGIQAEVEGYADGYDPDSMLFMDFRRHHTGLWNSTAPRFVSWLLELYMSHTQKGCHCSIPAVKVLRWQSAV